MIRTIVILNVIWDFVGWWCLLSEGGITENVALVHINMWRFIKDKNNKAVRVLMAWLMLALGCMRLAWAMNQANVSSLSVSYLIQSGFIMSELSVGHMRNDRTTNMFCLIAFLGLCCSVI